MSPRASWRLLGLDVRGPADPFHSRKVLAEQIHHAPGRRIASTLAVERAWTGNFLGSERLAVSCAKCELLI